MSSRQTFLKTKKLDSMNPEMDKIKRELMSTDTIKYSVDLPVDLHRQFVIKAATEGVIRKHLIIKLIKSYVNNNDV